MGQGTLLLSDTATKFSVMWPHQPMIAIPEVPVAVIRQILCVVGKHDITWSPFALSWQLPHWLFLLEAVKVTSGDHMTMGCWGHLNCKPVAKHLNHHHMTMGILWQSQVQLPAVSLLVQQCCNFEQMLTEWLLAKDHLERKLHFCEEDCINHFLKTITSSNLFKNKLSEKVRISSRKTADKWKISKMIPI